MWPPNLPKSKQVHFLEASRLDLYLATTASRGSPGTLSKVRSKRRFHTMLVTEARVTSQTHAKLATSPSGRKSAMCWWIYISNEISSVHGRSTGLCQKRGQTCGVVREGKVSCCFSIVFVNGLLCWPRLPIRLVRHEEQRGIALRRSQRKLLRIPQLEVL